MRISWRLPFEGAILLPVLAYAICARSTPIDGDNDSYHSGFNPRLS
jgi:hypothetical protein